MARKTRVFVVESPSPKDFLRNVHEGRTLCSALDHAGIGSTLLTVVNEDAFYTAIADIILDAEPALSGIVPFIHMSMHGNAHGIGLTDGTTLEWEELGHIFGFVNAKLDGRLFVAMSTCHGLEGARMAHRDGELPFAALVGPKRMIYWRDTIAAFVAMYHFIEATSGHVWSAVDVMNRVINAPNDDPLFDAVRGADEQANHLRPARGLAAAYAQMVREDMGAASGEGAQQLRDVLVGSLADIGRPQPK